MTHMLRSIIPSFVTQTMRARGAGLKKDRHTVIASNPGKRPEQTRYQKETKKSGITQNLHLLHYKEYTTFL